MAKNQNQQESKERNYNDNMIKHQFGNQYYSWNNSIYINMILLL